MSGVACTPTGATPQSSPASRPALPGSYTRTPASSSRGCSMTPRSDLVPMLPVAHCTTRIGGNPAPVTSAIVRQPVRGRPVERRLVEHVRRQAHVRGVDEATVAPDGADAFGLRLAIDRDRVLG